MEQVKSALRPLVVLALAVCMALCMSVSAFAANSAVDAAKGGVMKVNLDIDGQTYGRGSCFLINDTTVVTANHCVNLSQAEYDALYSMTGLNKDQVNASLTYTVTVTRDLTVSATLVNSSEEMDFAILQLDQPLSMDMYTSLKLADSAECQATDTVFALGYPASKDTTGWFTSDDVKTESAVLNQGEYETSMEMGAPSVFLGYTTYAFRGKTLMMSANTLEGGISGGPLVNEDGAVIGVCIASDGSSSYASASSQIMATLDRLAVSYEKVTDDALDTSSLAGIIDECKGLNQSEYTSDSWNILQTALSDAQSTLESVNSEITTKSTQAEIKAAQEKVDKAYNDLAKAKGGLVQASDYTLPIIIAIVVVVIIIVVIVLVVVMGKRKKGGKSDTSAAAPKSSQTTVPAAPPASAPAEDNQGSEGTEVLGASSTSMPAAVIIREKDGKQVRISKPEFRMGKQKAKVDYCIDDNTAISRIHAIITYREGTFYITDNRTTNHTILNGEVLAGGAKTKLSDGDIIKMADERFAFKLV